MLKCSPDSLEDARIAAQHLFVNPHRDPLAITRRQNSEPIAKSSRCVAAKLPHITAHRASQLHPARPRPPRSPQ